VKGANQADANNLLLHAVPQLPAQEVVSEQGRNQEPGGHLQVLGLLALVSLAKIPAEAALKLDQELTSQGAGLLKELTQEDWQPLASWSCLGQFAQRRLLGAAFNMQW